MTNFCSAYKLNLQAGNIAESESSYANAYKSKESEFACCALADLRVSTLLDHRCQDGAEAPFRFIFERNLPGETRRPPG